MFINQFANFSILQSSNSVHQFICCKNVHAMFSWFFCSLIVNLPIVLSFCKRGCLGCITFLGFRSYSQGSVLANVSVETTGLTTTEELKEALDNATENCHVGTLQVDCISKSHLSDLFCVCVCVCVYSEMSAFNCKVRFIICD